MHSFPYCSRSGSSSTATVVRTCTEFSHERSHSASSPVSKLLIQPASVHMKSHFHSVSRWPTSSSRNPGVTLLHASEHVSILPVRTIPAGRLKQLITSPMLSTHSHQPSSTNGTSTTMNSTTEARPSPLSYSPQSSASPSQQQHHGRPLRVAQPPPFTNASGSVPSTSFPTCSSSHYQQLPASMSVPSLHRHKSSTASQQQFTRSSASASALGERFGRMSYDELLDMARNQQRQIETNEAELDERRKAVALFGVARRTAGSESEQQQNATMLMANLRAQIEREEQELTQLGYYQRETRQLRNYNQNQSRELRQLESEFSQDEHQLRRTAQKVNTLRATLESIYRQRAAAADSAIAVQREINGTAGIGKIPTERRPKASVSPFKSEAMANHLDEPDYASITKRPAAPPPQTTTSTDQVVHWRRDSTSEVNQQQNGLHSPTVDKISRRPNSIQHVKRNSLISEGQNGVEHTLALLQAQRRGQNHISFGQFGQSLDERNRSEGKSVAGGLVANAKANLGFSESMDNQKDRRQQPLQKPESSTFRMFKENGKTIENGGTNNVKRREDVSKLIHQFNEPQNAAKKEAQRKEAPIQIQTTMPQKQSSPSKSSPVKRAIPLENNNLDTFNKIFKEQDQKMEKREQKKDEEKEERPEVETIVSEEEHPIREEAAQKHPPIQAQESEDKEDEEEEVTSESTEEERVVESPPTPNEKQTAVIINEEDEAKEEDKCENADEENMQMLDDLKLHTDPNFEHLEQEEHPDIREVVPGGSPTNSTNSSSRSTSAELKEENSILFDNSWRYQQAKLGVKGIISTLLPDDKNRPMKNRKRHVQFDLVVLFLDIAYEGLYEEMLEIFPKIENISVANSEGITALHYAICSNSADIVHFLIDQGADVNALDVDGWSPLHCAASCNNLPMLRLLIENGACPFATTISKSETAAQIFDESSDYAAGAEYMALVEECMGEVNEGKVYTAYSYDAQRDDELSFEEGAELRVLRKSEKIAESQQREKEDSEEEDANEHLWWLCEHIKRGDQGLVPRNYLALFPSHKYRDCYHVDIQFPQLFNNSPVENDTSEHAEDDESSSPTEETNGQIGMKTTKPLGHQELSTYA